jgi:thiamine phosphate synthase YjbQ (UPF0047 family)
MRQKIEGLPYGACSKVAAKLGVSKGLVQMVARGRRCNVIVYEELLRVKRDYQARMKRIERLKAKLNQESTKQA